MTSKNTRPGPRPDHRPRNVQPKHHDTYLHAAKPPGGMVCERCGVLSFAGKWSFTAPHPEGAKVGICPACARIRDHYPAGTLRLKREFLEHAAEIRQMIANVEEVEKAEHPLERVMDIEESQDGLVVTTTGVHLARRIANALERRFHKQAKFRSPAEQNLLFVELE